MTVLAYSDDQQVPYSAICPHGEMAEWTSVRDHCKTTAEVSCDCPPVPVQRSA